MASPLAFVPRKVTTSRKPAAQTSANIHPRISSQPLTAEAQNTTDSKGKAKAKETDGSDYAILISLALSNHAIWSDPDLRRLIEWSNEGFVPLSQLLRNSTVISSSGLQMEPETAIVKALRLHASDVLEVRVLVSQPPRSVWFQMGNSNKEDDVGGYEIRRKDWNNQARPDREYTKGDWEERTLYMENIPAQHRTIAGVVRFTRFLIPYATSIEAVTLPLHHQDQPGDTPKCKGFALVTLLNTLDLDHLLEEWPWARNGRNDSTLNGEGVGIREEARKYGFRVLPKSQWDALQEEYLVYRRTLLDEIAAFEDDSAHYSQTDARSLQRSQYEGNQAYLTQPGESRPSATTSAFQVLDITSQYPPNCLIFARNVHPETNKTTLRSLFSTAFKDTDAGEGLDYVDFNKGMDSCYLRLATSSHTSILSTYFSTHPTAQSSGLDDKGTVDTTNVITMEIVKGKKEEVYWEKVPEKVRRIAVQKQVSLRSAQAGIYEEVSEAGGGGTRKRRKR